MQYIYPPYKKQSKSFVSAGLNSQSFQSHRFWRRHPSYTCPSSLATCPTQGHHHSCSRGEEKSTQLALHPQDARSIPSLASYCLVLSLASHVARSLLFPPCRRRRLHGVSGAGRHPRGAVRVRGHRRVRLRRRGLRLRPLEDVQGHGDAGRAAGGGGGARAGAGRGGGAYAQRVGRARQPGRHVRRARRPPHLVRARRALLGRAAARRRARRASPQARLGRHAPHGLHARPRHPRAARAAAGGRHDVRPRVHRVRHRRRPELQPRQRSRRHSAPRHRLRGGREHPRRRAVRWRGHEPGARVRAGARRLELAPPLGLLGRAADRRRPGRRAVRVCHGGAAAGGAAGCGRDSAAHGR